MGDILPALANTPLPTILVVAGLFFVLISLADRVMAKITVPDARKNSARIMGIVLIVAGCGLWILPSIANRNSPDDGKATATLPAAAGGTVTVGASTGGGSPVAAGPYVIQIYALSSSTAAEDALRSLRTKYPDLLGTLEPQIRSVDDPTHGTLYRVSFGTFATLGEADQRCFQLREKGAEACRPVPKN